MTILRTLALATAAFGFAHVANATQTDWPTFGHDLTRGAYNSAETKLGTSNVSKLKRHRAIEVDGGAIAGQVGR